MITNWLTTFLELFLKNLSDSEIQTKRPKNYGPTKSCSTFEARVDFKNPLPTNESSLWSYFKISTFVRPPT